MASFIGKFYHPLFYSAIPHTVVCGSALLEQRVWISWELIRSRKGWELISSRKGDIGISHKFASNFE